MGAVALFAYHPKIEDVMTLFKRPWTPTEACRETRKALAEDIHDSQSCLVPQRHRGHYNRANGQTLRGYRDP